MKKLFAYSVRGALIAAPLFLVACDGMSDYFGSSSSPDYTYSRPVPRTRIEDAEKATAKSSDNTRVVQPGISTVHTPAVKSSVNSSVSDAAASSTAHAVPATGPAVPSMVPTAVSQ